MADAKKEKLELIRSPKGTAAYAWLREPDSGREFSDDKYKVTLVLPKEGAENQDEIDAFVESINKAHVKARGKKKTESPVKDGYDKDKEEFADKWLLNFKSKRPVGLVDAKKRPLADDINIYSGDVIRVAFVMVPYDKGKNAGVSLGLRAVQLIEKNANFVGSGEEAFDEEDGFEGGAAGGNDDSDFE